MKEHGKEVYLDVRAAYIDTMNKVLFRMLLFADAYLVYLHPN